MPLSETSLKGKREGEGVVGREKGRKEKGRRVGGRKGEREREREERVCSMHALA